jgi:RNA-binding protein
MKHLQRVGRVLHVSSSRNIIVKVEKKIPKLGEKVVDENLNIVGEVFDIIGPVSSPYISVKPKTEKPENFVNKVVYAVSPSPKKRKRK